MARPAAAGVWWCGLLGVAGSVAVVAGAARPGSPFGTQLPGAWYFGTAAGAGGSQWLGVLLVWGGVLAMVAAWYCLARFWAAGQRPARLWAVLAAWTVPLAVGPPLFSRDVFAYAAYGRLVAGGASPYGHAPQALGPSPLLTLVDPLWRGSHAPYGPLFMDLAGVASGRSIPATVVGFRVLAVAGVVLVAAGVGPLARSVGGDPGRAFALAACNPLVLLYLVGGAHNDALMLGLLVAGVAVGRRYPVAGVLLCALAAAVKVPAFLGVLYVGWAGPAARRWVRLAGAVGLGAAALVTVSAASGLGWGWLTDLSTPGAVVSWLDPATAAGRAVGDVTAARDLFLALAGLLAVVLLVRSDRIGAPAAIGWSLLAFALAGPVVWPWYETWGLVFLAVAGTAGHTAARRVVLVLSAVGCFATVPAALHLSLAGGLAVAGGLAAVATGLAVVVAGQRRLAGCPRSSWSTGPSTVDGAAVTSAGG
ncbi:MAG TPA: polyprenol phosphomannose-dependent alpha 1,6 mannosyltransferase MptB [Acidimicrobiales bacterium]|nr:polyprenol phosphomannose-dependent alpha 1,6 mannosyltransferase MptB [Acidimicrobiales bacterium]